MTGHTVVNNEKIYHDGFITFAQQGRRSVRSGCEVSENSPADMGVVVTSGVVYFDTSEINVSGGIIPITSADPTFDRFDNVVVTTTGLVIVLDGTPSSDPRPPAINPDDYLILARVTVENGVSQINDADIKDLRTLFTLPPLNTDTTKVLKTGDTMTGVLTTPIVVISDNLVREGEQVGYPRITTSEIITLTLATTEVHTSSVTLDTSSNYIVETRIKNYGNADAYVDFNTSAVAPTLNNTIVIYPNEEIVILSHEFGHYGGITSSGTARLEITNLFGDRSSIDSGNIYINKREIEQISGSGNFSGSFSSLTPTTMLDAHIVCNGTTDIYVNFYGTADANDIKVEVKKTKQYNNVPFTTFNIYSTDTTEVRVLGVGR